MNEEAAMCLPRLIGMEVQVNSTRCNVKHLQSPRATIFKYRDFRSADFCPCWGQSHGYDAQIVSADTICFDSQLKVIESESKCLYWLYAQCPPAVCGHRVDVWIVGTGHEAWRHDHLMALTDWQWAIERCATPTVNLCSYTARTIAKPVQFLGNFAKVS